MSMRPKAETPRVEIALSEALALYDTYVRLTRYCSISDFEADNLWAHQSEMPLSLVVRTEE